MLNSKLHKICQPLNSKLKFWNFPLFLSLDAIKAISVLGFDQCLEVVNEHMNVDVKSKENIASQEI